MTSEFLGGNSSGSRENWKISSGNTRNLTRGRGRGESANSRGRGTQRDGFNGANRGSNSGRGRGNFWNTYGRGGRGGATATAVATTTRATFNSELTG